MPHHHGDHPAAQMEELGSLGPGSSLKEKKKERKQNSEQTVNVFGVVCEMCVNKLRERDSESSAAFHQQRETKTGLVHDFSHRSSSH